MNEIDVIKLIDEDIKIQRKFLKKIPQHKKSIEWRITGMKLLKNKLRAKQTTMFTVILYILLTWLVVFGAYLIGRYTIW